MKQFQDTSYTLVSTAEGPNLGGSGNCGYGTIINANKTTSSFYVQTCNAHFSGYYWYACGRGTYSINYLYKIIKY